METHTGDQMELPIIYVYTKEGCAPCRMTKLKLKKLGLPFSELSLESAPEEKLDQFRKQGLLSAPIVIFGKEIWSGYRDERLEALASSYGLA